MIGTLNTKLSNKLLLLKNGNGFQSKVSKGAFWTFMGFGGSTFLRMLSSLILTRIFMPEIFGLMAIITAITIGIALFSDLGIATSIVQNPKGKDRDFLQTAWTLQVIRGFILWLGIIAISAPAASLYSEPELLYILPVVGLSFVITGFTSTSLPLYQREMKVKPIVVLELISQAFTLIFTVVLASIFESVWAFVISGLLASLIKLLGSYIYLKSGVVGFKWDKEIGNELIHFGKWIFLATILTFIVGKGDRLLLGGVISKSDLGLYNLSALFSQIALGLLSALISKTIMPAIASIAQSERKLLSQKFNKMRTYVLLTLLPVVITLAVLGEVVIKLLYEEAYHQAGWMLQVLSAGMVVRIMCMSISPIFLSKGDSYYHMLSYLYWSIIFILAMLVGFHFYGLNGVIIGISLAPLLWLPIISFLAKKYIDINHKFNLLILLISGVIILSSWWFMGLNINNQAFL